MGYLYYLHDKMQETKKMEESGSNLMGTGILLIIISIIVAFLFGRAEFLGLAVLGILLLLTGMHKHSEMSKLHVRERSEAQKKKVQIEFHHRPFNPKRIISPGIISHKLARGFSEDVSAHYMEREHIGKIIEENSGVDINTIYRIYRLQGGTYAPEHFVTMLHSLKRHGVVKVRKSISQTSLIPSVST